MAISTRMSANQAARKLMEALEQLRLRSDATFWSTSEVLKASGLSPTARGQQLKVLTRLANKGLVTRVGRGQFSWRLDKAYDPANIDLSSFDDSVSSSDDEQNKPVKTCRKCGGTGEWVNPNNSADRRPCFYCQGDKARNHSAGLSDADKAMIEQLKAQVEALKQIVEANSRSRVTIDIKRGEVKVKSIKDVTLPSYFDEMVDLAKAGENIYLVGPAGSGKTFAGELLAKTLDRNFGAISCTAGMSEVHLLGRSIPNLKTGKSSFQTTAFLECYENGGVFLLDEVDAADSNLLLALNAAISNGYANVPNREDNPTAKMHPDFICIAAANTYGRGADRQYVGRNQLDASTLDRFAMGTIEVDYDRTVEASLCPNTELLQKLWSLREAIMANGLRRILSTRFITKAAKMSAAGWSLDKIRSKAMMGWSKDEVSRVTTTLANAEALKNALK